MLIACRLLSIQAAIDRGKLRLPPADGIAKGPPDMARVLACAQEMASALRYLHDQQINHGALCLRDIDTLSGNVRRSPPAQSPRLRAMRK